MSLTPYRRHTSKCSQGRSRHERSFESDELRRGFKKCQCPIQFEGKIKGAGFVRKSTEKVSWEEAKHVAAAWEATVGVVDSLATCPRFPGTRCPHSREESAGHDQLCCGRVSRRY